MAGLDFFANSGGCPMATLKFCGAAGTVTGSCSLIQTPTTEFLVDCGLFQGNRTTQQLNYEPFPFDVAAIDFLVLTHAHIDHTGLVPKLVKAGFRGPIYATQATCDLLRFMLPDSAHIQESNTERLNKKKQRKGEPLLQPLYTLADAEQALKQLEPHEYEEWLEPASGIRLRSWNAGHLLGSASVEVQLDAATGNTLRLLFSGDLGPEEKAFHPEPDAPTGYDYIICESTYGDREREDYTLQNRREALRAELVRGLNRGGNVVIPSFAVERSQELLHDIGTLLAEGAIPDAQVFLDSPLARRVTEVFIKHAAALQDVEVDERALFRHKNFHLVESVQESKAINQVKRGAIIISASGMCTAGRIKHHLKNNIWRPECTILFVGYQAPGTLGQIITSGAQDVRIHGSEYRVKADIRRLGNYSAHADQSELIEWVVERGPVAGGLFLNHGDDAARRVMRGLLADQGLDPQKIYLPQFDQSYDLVGGSPTVHGVAEPRIDVESLHRDWYNDYAAFVLELSNRLEGMDDPCARRALIQRVAAALDSEPS
jgi:metallo-beta-lactamase family protein